MSSGSTTPTTNGDDLDRTAEVNSVGEGGAHPSVHAWDAAADEPAVRPYLDDPGRARQRRHTRARGAAGVRRRFGGRTAASRVQQVKLVACQAH